MDQTIIFLTFDKKVTIQVVGFHYFNMYANTTNDLISLTFENKEQMDKQLKLLDEYNYKYTIIRTEGYPCITISSDKFIPYSAHAVKEFQIICDMQTTIRGAYKAVYGRHIINDGKIITIIPDESSIKFAKYDKDEFNKVGIPCVLNKYKQFELDAADLINIKF